MPAVQMVFQHVGAGQAGAVGVVVHDGLHLVPGNVLRSAGAQLLHQLLHRVHAALALKGKAAQRIAVVTELPVQRLDGVQQRLALLGVPGRGLADQQRRVDSVLVADVAAGQLYVMEDAGGVYAVFAFIIGDDPTYQVIDGAWLDDGTPYGTLHRLGSDGTHSFFKSLEAQQDFIAQQETAELFENTSAETLRDRYRIHVENIEQLQETADQVKQVNGIADVEASLEIADGFVMVRNVATAIAVILIVMLVVISVFIIANTIKLSTFTRREEIAIMKMCGATNWFVRAPFLVEGVILGLAGGIIAFFCQWGIYGLITRAMMESGIFSIITTVPFGNISHVVLLVFLLVGFAIGGGGSVMAIRKFLKV